MKVDYRIETFNDGTRDIRSVLAVFPDSPHRRDSKLVECHSDRDGSSCCDVEYYSGLEKATELEYRAMHRDFQRADMNPEVV